MTTLKQLTRWDEWAESKTPLFFAAAYTWLLTQRTQVTSADLARAGLWLVFTMCLLAYGYAVNDFSDVKPDRLANKSNAIGRLPQRHAVLFLLFLVLAGLFSLLFYLSQPWVVLSLLMAYFFATAYSLPPIRFKERGLMGLIVSSTAQRFFPLLVGMSVFGRFDLVSWTMAAVFSLMGLRWILVHQLGDIEADRRGGVRSFARARGAPMALRLMQWVIFPLEFICLLAWVAIAARQAAIVLLAWPLYGLWLAVAARNQQRFPISWARFGELPLTHFYLIFWPLALATPLVLDAPTTIGFVVLQLLAQRSYLSAEWRKLFSKRATGVAP